MLMLEQCAAGAGGKGSMLLLNRKHPLCFWEQRSFLDIDILPCTLMIILLSVFKWKEEEGVLPCSRTMGRES